MHIIEERKIREIEHYDEAVLRQSSRQVKDFEGFSPFVLGSYQFLYKIAVPLITDKTVLDYGCGNGFHISFLAEHAREVVGIDLSEASLAIARGKILSLLLDKTHDREGNQTKQKVKFLKMDCEAMEFPAQSFDVVFDGGAFSSLDFDKAMGEITRVLRPNGALVGIETFGHNPLANAKRMLNRLTGKRTVWAASHIVRQKELGCLQQSFESCRVHYFHLLSLFAFPFLGLPGSTFLLRFLEGADKILLKIPFLQKYAFKVVFVCSKPKTW